MSNSIPNITKYGITITFPDQPDYRYQGQPTRGQSAPSVIGFEDGSFSVAYDGTNYYGKMGIVQKFDENGSPVNAKGFGPVDTSTMSVLTGLKGFRNGSYALVWRRKGQSSDTIYLKFYDSQDNSSGLAEFNNRTNPETLGFTQVNSLSQGKHENPAVAATSEGGLIVTWQTNTADGSGNGIMAVRYNQNYQAVWESPEPVNNYSLSEQENPAIITLNSPIDTNKDGINDPAGFLVAWQSKGQDGSDWGIYARRYDEANNPIASEFRVNTTTTHAQKNPVLTPLINGGFLVLWESDKQDGSGYGIFAQRYDTLGNRVGQEFKVNTYTNLDQTNVAAETLNDGSVVVAWQSQGQDGSGYGIYGQMFDIFGNRIGNEFKVNSYSANDQTLPTIAKRGNNGFVIAWQGEFTENNPVSQAQMYTWPGYAPPYFSINDVQIPENGGVAKLTINLSEALPQTVYVNWETVNNTAGAYLDYVPKNGQLEFKPGDTTKVIEVPILNDTNDEPDENFYVYLKNASTNNIIDPLGIVTIQPPVNTTILFNADNITVKEGGKKATITLNLSKANANLVTVDYFTENNTALKDFDYFAKTGTIEFQPGETQKAIDLEIRDDDIVEAQESFLVKFNNTRFATLSKDTVVVNIDDNDKANEPPYVVTAIPDIKQGDFTKTRIYLPDYFKDKETSNLTFKIDGTYSKSIRPEINSNYLDIEYLNYVNTSLRIKATDTEGASVTDTFDIKIEQINTGDKFEPNNTTITAPTLTPVNGLITAKDLSIHTEQDVDYFRFNLPQVGTKDNFVRIDFNNSLGDLDLDLYRWNKGQWSLTTVSDSSSNQELISLSSLVSGDYLVKVFGFNGATNPDYDLSIQVGGTKQPTNLAIVAKNALQAEGNSGNKVFTFTVNRTGALSGTNAVKWAVTGSGTDAPNAADFGGTLPSGTVTFAANETSKEISVQVTGDLTQESNEKFTVTLANATNGATITTATATGTIQNDDFTGTAKADNLIGTTGADGLTGLGNNDTYTVNNLGDIVTEQLNGGTDTVNSSVNYTLPNNVENLTLTGTTAINGTGNALNNVLSGNSANNTLNGGAGNDILAGGTGADRFRFASLTERLDKINDFKVVDDTIEVSAAGFGGGLKANAAITSAQLVIGTTATNKSHRFIYNSTSGALFFDQDGINTVSAPVQIATLSTGLALTNNDIFVAI